LIELTKGDVLLLRCSVSVFLAVDESLKRATSGRKKTKRKISRYLLIF